MSIRAPRVLHQLHETLCFLLAYPDDADVLRRAGEALASFAARVGRLGPAAQRLDDSGIAGTFLDYPFGLPMARWLARTSPSGADIVWAKPVAESEIEETMSLLVLPIEGEAMSDEGGLGWRRWLRLAKGDRAASDLALLVELFDRAPLPPEARERLFDGLALSIGWRPEGARSRTLARLPWPHPFFHGGSRGPPSSVPIGAASGARSRGRWPPSGRRRPRSPTRSSTRPARRWPPGSASSSPSRTPMPTTSSWRTPGAASGSR